MRFNSRDQRRFKQSSKSQCRDCLHILKISRASNPPAGRSASQFGTTTSKGKRLPADAGVPWKEKGARAAVLLSFTTMAPESTRPFILHLFRPSAVSHRKQKQSTKRMAPHQRCVVRTNLHSFLLLTFFLFLHVPQMVPGVGACSCLGPTGSTGIERAASVHENPKNLIHIVFRGSILEIFSYKQEVNLPRDETWNAEFQNVTFSVDEILFNSDPTGSLPPNILVGDDGNMTAHTSTMTECCLCGLTIRGAVGEGYLVQLSTLSPETLNICDVTCSFEDDIFEGSGRICNDTANALRQEIGRAHV